MPQGSAAGPSTFHAKFGKRLMKTTADGSYVRLHHKTKNLSNGDDRSVSHGVMKVNKNATNWLLGDNETQGQQEENIIHGPSLQSSVGSRQTHLQHPQGAQYQYNHQNYQANVPQAHCMQQSQQQQLLQHPQPQLVQQHMCHQYQQPQQGSQNYERQYLARAGAGILNQQPHMNAAYSQRALQDNARMAQPAPAEGYSSQQQDWSGAAQDQAVSQYRPSDSFIDPASYSTRAVPIASVQAYRERQMNASQLHSNQAYCNQEHEGERTTEQGGYEQSYSRQSSKQREDKDQRSPVESSNTTRTSAKPLADRSEGDDGNAENKPSKEQVNERMVKTKQDQLFYSKKHRHVNYTPCSTQKYLKEKPKEYYELGKLNPDLNSEELVEKRKKAERMKEYARNIQAQNQQEQMERCRGNYGHNSASLRSRPNSSKKGSPEWRKAQSARQRALEFAKSVPRPKVRAKSDDAGVHGTRNAGGDPRKMTELEKMEYDHQRAREDIERIRREVGI